MKEEKEKMTEKIPSPSDIQKEISEFVQKKYGGKVILQQPDIDKEDEGMNVTEKPNSIDFDLKPEELEKFLKEYVVGQEEAIEIIATKICTHFNRMKLEDTLDNKKKVMGNIKSNILIIGPTGVGKTYVIKLIAKKIGVPFVKGDATKFSETGYVGGDVEELVRDLVRQADGDMKLAEYGIVYLDEIDKIASSGSHYGPDVSRTGVQRNLLKLMEEAEVDLKTPHDLAAQMEAAMQVQKTGKIERKKINTKNILFVVSGAFFELKDIIKKRMNKQKVGFGADIFSEKEESNNLVMNQIKTEDLVSYGFESEFVGRLPVISVFNDLDVEGLYQILKNPNSSVIQGKKLDFQAYGINLEFEDEALRKMAEMAHKEKTGARGLVSVCEKILIKFEKKLPSTNVKKLVVTKELIENPQSELEKLLVKSSMKKFQTDFLNETGILMEFKDYAVKEISKKADEQNTDFETVCKKLFKDYGYGLKLLKKDSFTVTEEVMKDPGLYLDNLITKMYKDQQQSGEHLLEEQ